MTLDGGGVLGAWQELNRSATIGHCIEQLEAAGNLHNLRRLRDPDAGPFKGFWFADSDLYKVLEAVGWEGGPRAFADETVALLRDVQEEDGYLNSWIQGVHPDRRWQELENSHELYCAGHMIQAAVALSRGAGRDDLLAVARRFADLIVERDPGLDGHPEIETALVELYRETGEPRYLEHATALVERRGRGEIAEHGFGARYLQDHAPVREATEPVGHAVRQLYLAAGVTDVYLEIGDASLLEAMERLWERTFAGKTYVTGAHGSRHRDEAFGDPYELPPDRAYAETCAAIASFMWNWRLLLATGDGPYADEMERALHNAIAVSTSLDGKHFTYTNPLQLRSGGDAFGRHAWFPCACCPPNIARLVASLHHYVATQDDNGVQLHLLAPGRIETGAASLTVQTDYPWDGRVEIAVDGGGGEWTLALRIPGWCEGATVDGEPAAADGDGYLRLRRRWDGRSTVRLELPMPVRVLRPHPRVDAVRGCVALARGPLVYCIEQADHDVAVEDLRLDPAAPPAEGPADEELGVPVTLVGPELTAIPYYRWANREPGAMRVWIPTTT